jgi:hypothetical protein
MAMISTRVHGAGDYATGAGLLAAPNVLGVDDAAAAAVLRGTGAAILGLSAVTDYELGIVRRLPMPAHLLIDAATGAALAAGGVLWLRRRSGGLADRLPWRGRGTANWLPHVLFGVAEIGAAAVTARRPADRSAGAASEAGPPAAEPAATALRGGTSPGGVSSPSVDEGSAAESRPAQTAPAEVPPQEEFDPLVAREEAAAAAAAARIGGFAGSPTSDPAMDPVYQAGGGEQEGWEQAEDLLIENATHGDSYADPERDAFSPEVESDRSTAAYGEPDAIRSTEVEAERVSDAQENPEGGPDTSGIDRSGGATPNPPAS